MRTGHARPLVAHLLAIALVIAPLVAGGALAGPVSTSGGPTTAAGAAPSLSETDLTTARTTRSDANLTTARTTRSDANLTTYWTNRSGFADAGAVAAAIENGTAEPAGPMVLNETLVVRVESDRLAGAMADAGGSPTERFFAALSGDLEFRLVQTNPGTMVSPLAPPLGPRNATVYRDGTTTFVLVDTGALTYRHLGSDRVSDIHGGERFLVQFGADLGDPWGADADAGPTVTLHRYRSAFVALGQYYEPLPTQWVAATVDVAIPPDESLVVRLTLDGNRTVTRPVAGAADGGFREAWLDLRDVAPGTPYVLELVRDGRVVDRYEGAVTEPRATVSDAALAEVSTNVTVTRNGERVEETVTDHVALTATVELSHGGKLQVLGADCERLGTTWVEPGNETRVIVRLWDDGKPVRNLDADPPAVRVRTVRGDGVPTPLYEGEEATASLGGAGACPPPRHGHRPGPTPTPYGTSTPGATAATTAGATTATTVTPTSSPTPQSTSTASPPAPTTPTQTGPVDTTTPGFGVVAGLLALLAAVVLLRARQ